MNRIGSTGMKITIEYVSENIHPDDLQAVQAILFYKLQSFNSKVSKVKLRYFPCLITTLNPICSRLFFINIIFNFMISREL